MAEVTVKNSWVFMPAAGAGVCIDSETLKEASCEAAVNVAAYREHDV